MATNTGTPKEVDLRKCAGVGQGIQRDVADDIRKEIEGMPTLPFYQQKESAQYPFEALDSSTIQGAVKPVVDAWLNDDENTKRIASRFGITATLELLAWSVIRTRAAKSPKQMQGGLFNNKHEIATFIALGDWKESSGIFAVRNWSGREEGIYSDDDSNDKLLSYIELRSGEDVSVNGADTLFFSGKEGGLALVLRFQAGSQRKGLK